MEIKEVVSGAHKNAYDKGFWKDFKYLKRMEEGIIKKEMYHNAISKRLTAIHSEVSEAYEALKIQDLDKFEEELADIIIYTLGMCGGLDIDIEKVIVRKMRENELRPHLHGKSF